MNDEYSHVAKQWRKVLAAGGYERTIRNRLDFDRLTRLTRTWKCILQITNLKPSSSFFEVGCGGGNQLVPLALRDYQCSAIDCSEEVLARCRDFIVHVEKFAEKSLDISLACGDFLSYPLQGTYDCVFNFGVIEHFLDDQVRALAIGKMFSTCKPGGYVVSVVPSGQHPMRERMRKEGLGGYQVPEIDYTCDLMATEMFSAGAVTVNVMPVNLFAYLTIIPSTPILRVLRKLYYYFWQLIPLSALPRQFACKHAFGLIGIAKKPGP